MTSNRRNDYGQNPEESDYMQGLPKHVRHRQKPRHPWTGFLAAAVCYFVWISSASSLPPCSSVSIWYSGPCLERPSLLHIWSGPLAVVFLLAGVVDLIVYLARRNDSGGED